MMTDRSPCINPRCRRTFRNEGTEVICGKCFRALPAGLRNEFKRLWREFRKWDRRMKRTSDDLKIHRMRDVRDRFGALIDRHWDDAIKPYLVAPEKPEGLDAFLEGVGL